MEVDATVVADGATWRASICILGAGPAGLALAESLRETGQSIIVLDRGVATIHAVDDEPLIQPGDDIDREAFAKTYAWGIGGTATIWNTIISEQSWAKYVPLDEADFTERTWVPWSGWPWSHDTLRPWYARAHTMCATGGGHGPVLATPERGALRMGRYHLGPSMRFCAGIPSALRSSANVQLVRGAVATGFERTAGGRIAGVHWHSANGVRGTVRADHFVLALGALENARFLLDDRTNASTARPPSTWLGCGFMEHPIDRSLLVHSRGRAGRLGDVLYTAREIAGQGQAVGRIGFDPDLLREERLPNMSLRSGGGGQVALAPPAQVRSRLRRVIPSERVRRLIGNAVRGVLTRRDQLRGTDLRLFMDLEQWPQPGNRVVLTGQRGRYGQALATVQWQWRAEEEAMRQRAHAVVRRELERHGLGAVHVTPDLPINPHAHHHAGTTRMHENPAQGVVDADLRVHGEENLYVAGSSVLPTAGVANPTLTIVALSIRLAAYLNRS